MIVISRETYDGQAKGSWLAIQCGYTLIYFKNLWKRDRQIGPWVRLYIAAPSHDPQIGYRCIHYGIWLSLPIIFRTKDTPKYQRHHFRLSINAGGGFAGLANWMR